MLLQKSYVAQLDLTEINNNLIEIAHHLEVKITNVSRAHWNGHINVSLESQSKTNLIKFLTSDYINLDQREAEEFTYEHNPIKYINGLCENEFGEKSWDQLNNAQLKHILLKYF
ncbi:MAG: hypothetical protein HRU31_18845 [Rhodobacteraceae bacterium]|nr:hypothetical protein [Paracoccaceae bacterium]